MTPIVTEPDARAYCLSLKANPLVRLLVFWMYPFLLSIVGLNDIRLTESYDLKPNQEAEENLSLIATMRKSSAKPLRRNAKASARQGRHGRMQQARRRAMQH